MMLKHALVLVLLCSATTALAAAAAPPGMQLPPQPKTRPAGMPAGYLMVSPCVAGMGEHWANPRNLLAPIYGTYQGKVIFSEIMVPLKTLNSGFNYGNLKALPGHAIDHVSIEWHPKGHTGMLVPHYDVHAYYIPYTQQVKLCPHGLPDPDAKGMSM
jgi:hypothetical protein